MMGMPPGSKADAFERSVTRGKAEVTGTSSNRRGSCLAAKTFVPTWGCKGAPRAAASDSVSADSDLEHAKKLV